MLAATTLGAIATTAGCSSAPPGAGVLSPPSEASAPETSGAAITLDPVAVPRTSLLDATFEVEQVFHPVHIVSPGFASIETGPHVARRTTLHKAELPAPFVGIELDILAPAADTGTDTGTAVVGLLTDDGQIGILATWQPDTGVATLELVQHGKPEALHTTRFSSDGKPTSLGFALCENQVTLLVRSGKSQWRALLTERTAVAAALDARSTTTLQQLKFVTGARDGSIRIDSARAGLFGMAGLRDPHLVQQADGTPYVLDGWAYMTWTCAGLGFFQQAHWGVFRMRLDDPRQLQQVAHIFSQRDGRVIGDHAGQLVRDGDRWIVAVSAWGDFDGSGVHVRHTSSTADLLNGVHVLETKRAELPTALSSWDPALTRIDGRWLAAFVESPSQSPFDFHPVVATTSEDDPFVGLQRAGGVDRSHQTEGLIIARDHDGWRVLASDGDARCYRIHDVNLHRLGTLAAPFGSNIPHAQVIPCGAAGWLMPTFDGTSLFADVVGYGAHGSVVVMRSRPHTAPP